MGAARTDQIHGERLFQGLFILIDGADLVIARAPERHGIAAPDDAQPHNGDHALPPSRAASASMARA